MICCLREFVVKSPVRSTHIGFSTLIETHPASSLPRANTTRTRTLTPHPPYNISLSSPYLHTPDHTQTPSHPSVSISATGNSSCRLQLQRASCCCFYDPTAATPEVAHPHTHPQAAPPPSEILRRGLFTTPCSRYCLRETALASSSRFQLLVLLSYRLSFSI